MQHVSSPEHVVTLLLSKYNFNGGDVLKISPVPGGMTNGGNSFIVDTKSKKVVLRCMPRISREDSLYVAQFTEWMESNAVAVPRLYTLAHAQNLGTPQENKFVYQDQQGKSYVLEDFVNGTVLDMYTRSDPSHPMYPKVMDYYFSLGVIAAEINNAVIHGKARNSQESEPGFKPAHFRTFQSRESVVDSMNFDHLENLKKNLETREIRSLNSCEKFFQDNFPLILLSLNKQFTAFKKNWKPEKMIKSHVHNDLHFQNIIFEPNSTKILGVIDWERAQFDFRIVEFNNIIMALINPADKNREKLFYDVGDIVKVFLCTLQAYQANLKTKLCEEEILGAWEVIRVRALEVFWKNFDPNLSYFAFNNPSRLQAVKNHLELIQNFPEVCPT